MRDNLIGISHGLTSTTSLTLSATLQLAYNTSQCFCPPFSPNQQAMAPKKLQPLFLILLTIIFFTCVSSSTVQCPPTTPLPPTPQKSAKCPKDTLKFGVCGSWLGLVYENIGAKPSNECCTLVAGLADLEAALCLCTAIKANVLGVYKLTVPVAISLVVNSCGKKVPDGFKCS